MRNEFRAKYAALAAGCKGAALAAGCKGAALAAGCKGAALAAAVALMTVAQAGPGAARSPERPLILLSCPDGTPDGTANRAADRALCREMVQALAEAAAGPHIIRQVPRGDESPRRPGDIGVALIVEDTGAHFVIARLDWEDADGVRHQGPAVRLDVMDATVTPRSRARFARDLIRATPGMQSALRAAPPR